MVSANCGTRSARTRNKGQVGAVTGTGSTFRKYIHQTQSKSSIRDLSGSIAKSSGHTGSFSGRVRSYAIQSSGIRAYAEQHDLTAEACFETLLTGLALRYYNAVAT